MGNNKNETQTLKAYEKIEAMIMLRELNPEDMYSEAQIASLVKLGRTPVREALQRLAHEQVVKIIPYRGIQIIPASVETQLKLLEVRREVEKLTVRLAAARATTNQKLKMSQQATLIIEYAEKKDDRGFVKALKQIHDTIVEATGNEFIRQTMLPLQILSRRFWFNHQQQNQSKSHPAHLHADILNAIVHGDELAAEKASEVLINYLTDFTYNTLKNQGIIGLPTDR